MPDATVDSSTTPAPIEDTFYKSQDADSTPAKDSKDPNSGAPSKEGAAQTEAVLKGTEPAEHETEPEDKGNKSPRLSFRELRTQRDQAQARADLLEKQLAERNKAAPPPAAPVADVKPVADPNEPKSEDFPTYDDYLRAREKYNRGVWDREQVAKSTEAERAKAIEEIKKVEAQRLDDWNTAEKIVMAKQPDYTAHFNLFLEAAKYNQALAAAVYKSKIGPDIAQYLGANSTDELIRLAKLTGDDVTKAIGVLEAKLTEGSGKPTITKAPPPLGKVNGQASAAPAGTALEDRFYKSN